MSGSNFFLTILFFCVICSWIFYTEWKKAKNVLDAYVYLLTTIVHAGILAQNHLYYRYKKLTTNKAKKKYAVILTIGIVFAVMLGLGIGIGSIVWFVPNLFVWHLSQTVFFWMILSILGVCLLFSLGFLRILNAIKDEKPTS